MAINTYLCITESLCCAAEINTTLYINYMSIKKISIKQRRRHQPLRTDTHPMRTDPRPAGTWTNQSEEAAAAGGVLLAHTG